MATFSSPVSKDLDNEFYRLARLVGTDKATTHCEQPREAARCLLRVVWAGASGHCTFCWVRQAGALLAAGRLTRARASCCSLPLRVHALPVARAVPPHAHPGNRAGLQHGLRPRRVAQAVEGLPALHQDLLRGVQQVSAASAAAPKHGFSCMLVCKTERDSRTCTSPSLGLRAPGCTGSACSRHACHAAAVPPPTPHCRECAEKWKDYIEKEAGGTLYIGAQQMARPALPPRPLRIDGRRLLPVPPFALAPHAAAVLLALCRLPGQCGAAGEDCGGCQSLW